MKVATAPPQSTPAQALLPLLLAGLTGLLLGILLSLVCFIKTGQVSKAAQGASAKSQRQFQSVPDSADQDAEFQESPGALIETVSPGAPLLAIRAGPLTPASRRALVNSP